MTEILNSVFIHHILISRFPELWRKWKSRWFPVARRIWNTNAIRW